MATGNQVLPGAPANADHDGTAGRAAAAEQAIRAQHAAAAGLPVPGQAATGGSAWSGNRAGQPDSAADRPLARPRRGAGGRWLVWMLRVVVWLVLLLVGYRGVAAIVTGSGSSRGGQSQPAGGAGRFPAGLARAYVLDFGQAYLGYNSAAATRRAARLAPFLPAGTDPELGWNGIGKQTLQSEQVAGITVLSPHSAIVTLLAEVNGGQLIEVAVPVYSTGAGMVISGLPALLPPPPASEPPAVPKVTADPVASRALDTILPAFFRAFANGSQAGMRPFVADGVRLTGLGGAVSFGGLSQLTVPSSRGVTRHLVVTVRWVSLTTAAGAGQPADSNSAAQTDMTYAMTVVRHGRSWLVQSIGAAAVQPGSSS